MARHFAVAMRQLLASELRCPECGAENVAGDGGEHISIDEYGLAVCRRCGRDWKPIKENHEHARSE